VPSAAGLRQQLLLWRLAIVTALLITTFAAFFAAVTTPMPAVSAVSVHEKVNADESTDQQNRHPVVQYPLHGHLSFSKA
jgi:hypothetical protein